jgi:hypothetical protein
MTFAETSGSNARLPLIREGIGKKPWTAASTLIA